MSAPLGTVLVASALVSSPVLWMVQDGSLSATDAVQRWVIVLVGCWLAITVVSAFAFPDARAATRRPATDEQRESDVPAEHP